MELFNWLLGYQQASLLSIYHARIHPIRKKRSAEGKQSKSGEIKEKQTEAFLAHSCIMAHFPFFLPQS